jgi:hypothetical protein
MNWQTALRFSGPAIIGVGTLKVTTPSGGTENGPRRSTPVAAA